MQRKALRFGKGFRVAFGNRRGQAAEMVLPPGGREGGPGNRHRGADQWLFVVSGTGVARVGGRRHPLRAGTLLLIEKGEVHEIENTGRSPRTQTRPSTESSTISAPAVMTKAVGIAPMRRNGQRKTAASWGGLAAVVRL